MNKQPNLVKTVAPAFALPTRTNGNAIKGARRRLSRGTHAVMATGLMAAAMLAQARTQMPDSSATDRPQDRPTTARANAEHPGVAQWRRAQVQGLRLDANRFLVQPPAAVTWLQQADEEPPVRMARR